MSPDAWIALASLGAFMLGQLSGLLIWGASLTQRVKSLEAQMAANADCSKELAALDATVNALSARLADFRLDTHAALLDLNQVIRNRLQGVQDPR